MVVVALWPLDTSEVAGHGLDLRLHVAFHDSLGHGVVVSIPGGSKGHPDQYGPSSSLDHDPKRGQRRQPLESA